MALSLAQANAMEEASWTPSFAADFGSMSRAASEAPSTSFASCSSFGFDAFDDSRPCSSQGSLKIKNTFIHLDKESSDSEDELDMRKSYSAPVREAHEPSACMSSIVFPVSIMDALKPSTRKNSITLPESALKGTKGYDACRTPKVTFDLTPTFFGGNSDERSMGSLAIGTASLDNSLPMSQLASSSSLYEVKNTFIHLGKSLAADSEPDLPTRCASEPAMLESCMSPVASPISACTRSSSFPGEGPSPPAAPKGLEAAAQLAGPMHRPAGSTSPLGLKLTKAPSVSSWPSSPGASSLGSSSFRIKNTFVHLDPDTDDDDATLVRPTKSVSQPELNHEQALSAVAAAGTQALAPTPALPSVGAALHGTGNCKPCAWFWKPEGCQWGIECGHCHLCPVGELRRRKKEKQAEAKQLKAALRAQQAS